MIDLEQAEPYDGKEVASEIEELRSELIYDSERGASDTIMY